MTPKEILLLPYRRVIIPDIETGTYTALIQEFPGCVAEGLTPAEAYIRIDEVAESWLEALLSQGKKVPKPVQDMDEYSYAQSLLEEYYVKMKVIEMRRTYGY